MSSEIKKHKKHKKSKHNSDEECNEKRKEVDTSSDVLSDTDESHRKKHKKSKKSKRTEDDMNEPLSVEVAEESHKKHKKSKKKKSHSHSEDEEDKPEKPEATDKTDKTDKADKTEEPVKSNPKLAIPEVHTANSWEKVDLGDDQRKLKFLKLMGAGKHQDTSDKGIKSRALRDNKKVEEDLEKQFTKGLTSKMLNSKHQGLGASNRPEPQNIRKTFSDSDNEDKLKKPEVKSVGIPKKTESTTQYSGFNAAAEAKLKFKKMSFVKSSS